MVISYLQKYGLNRLSDNYLHKMLFSVGHGFFPTIASPSLHITHRWHGSFDIGHVSGRWGSGGPPPENSWLKWCKTV